MFPLSVTYSKMIFRVCSSGFSDISTSKGRISGLVCVCSFCHFPCMCNARVRYDWWAGSGWSGIITLKAMLWSENILKKALCKFTTVKLIHYHVFIERLIKFLDLLMCGIQYIPRVENIFKCFSMFNWSWEYLAEGRISGLVCSCSFFHFSHVKFMPWLCMYSVIAFTGCSSASSGIITLKAML